MKSENSFLFRAVNLGLLLLIAFIWASSFGAMKVAVFETGPLSLAAIRSSIGALILIGFLRLRGPIDLLLFRQNVKGLFIVGGIGTAAPFVMIPWAEQYIDSSLAGLLMSIGPIATMFGAWLFGLEDEFSLRRIFGLLLGLSGAIFLLSDGFSAVGGTYLGAQLVTVCASLCYVVGNLTVRRMQHVNWLVIAAGGMSMTACILWPLALFIEWPNPHSWSLITWQMLLWLGVMPTALAFAVRYYLISRAGPSFTSYVGYLIPAIAVLLGYVFLQEAVTLTKLIALALILTGLVLAQKASAPSLKKQENENKS